MSDIGVLDYGTVAATVAATTVLQGGLSAVSAATAAGGSAIIPPGIEGASILGTAKQMTNVFGFIAALEQGLVQMQARNAVTAAHTAETAAVDAAGAAMAVGVSTDAISALV